MIRVEDAGIKLLGASLGIVPCRARFVGAGPRGNRPVTPSRRPTRSIASMPLGRLTKNEYPTKNLKSTGRLLVGCHTQASGYFWPGITTVLGFGGPPMTNEPMIP